jgi:foldase protein PrsA
MRKISFLENLNLKQVSAPKTLLKKQKKVFVTLAVIVIFASLAYYFKGQFVVAMVNGRPIWRWTLVRELEKQAGGQILDSLITKTLIFQEAKKQKISVSSEEIDQEVKKLEEQMTAQGQSLEQVLGLQGMTRETLEEQIEIRKIIEQIVGSDIEITEEEVDKYFEENKDYLPEDISREEVKEQLKQQKIGEEFQAWVESLRDGAQVSTFLRL